MSQTNGQLRTCDRCGNQVFLKCTGEREMDGGYTRWNTFDEKAAVGWSREHQIGDLCPECTKEYQTILRKFRESCKSFMEANK